MLDTINKIITAIPLDGAVVAFVAMAVEFGLRIWKTEKPRSIAYLIADGAKGIGALFSKVGAFLDKVLPQRVKE